MESRGTWLCPTAFDRERLVDMEARIGPARTLMFACLGLGLVSGVPWFGWWILVPLVWVIVFYLLLTPWIARSPRPEYPVAVSVVHAQVMLGLCVALTGGPHSPALPMLLLGVVTLPARFTGRGVVAGVVMTVAVLLAATVGVDPSGYADNPDLRQRLPGHPGGLAAISYVLMRSEREQRSDAILDPLTGLLNRKALMDRFVEIAEQAKVIGGSVSLIVCDLDRFKAVNDEYGHERGDSALKDAADTIRRNMRSFELVYRMGGEEFLILLPGAGLDDALEVAERARAAIARAHPGGLPLTASLGSPPPRPPACASSRCSAAPTRRCTAPRPRAATAWSRSAPSRPSWPRARAIQPDAGKARQGSPRRPGQGGRPVGTSTPETTGRTSRDGMAARVGDRDGGPAARLGLAERPHRLVAAGRREGDADARPRPGRRGPGSRAAPSTFDEAALRAAARRRPGAGWAPARAACSCARSSLRPLGRAASRSGRRSPCRQAGPRRRSPGGPPRARRSGPTPAARPRRRRRCWRLSGAVDPGRGRARRALAPAGSRAWRSTARPGPSRCCR